MYLSPFNVKGAETAPGPFPKRAHSPKTALRAEKIRPHRCSLLRPLFSCVNIKIL